MATLLRADGRTEEVHPKGTKWTLAELQALVGGYIEQMPGVGSVRMFFDEDGRLKGRPVNAAATAMVAEALKGKTLRYQPVIVGDVVVLTAGEKC
jgi:hypothetical protein